MYKLHLILKYLRKRRIAWVSLIAVALCTALVIVVISVMGGWLRMFRESFHGLTGDVLVRGRSLTGFPHYQEIIKRTEALPEVAAAVPMIKTFGLINIGNQIREGVQVMGLPIDQVAHVNRFRESLYRQYEAPVARGEAPPEPSFELLPDVPYERRTAAKNPRDWPGMIVGVGVAGIRKDADGNPAGTRREDLYGAFAKLTVLGVSAEDASVDLGNKAEQPFWIVDDSRTQIWQYDSQTVYVPFDVLQRMLKMEGVPATAEYEGDPPRASEVHIKLKPGVDLKAAEERIQLVVDEVMGERGIDLAHPYEVETWEESQAVWLGAIEKEKALVTFLFAMISIVAIFLIFCIFYMIVVEKTKDIGIIKSVGATSTGVAGIFLGYGMAIGLVGSGLGLLVAYLIVHNINEIHTWMGETLGLVVWNPEVYAFDIIPNTMDPTEVAWIITIAIVASVLGALVPAIRAARMNPVEALRWE
jgi:lipoprotein-releasing system permease protein